jgi:TPR repeat protein
MSFILSSTIVHGGQYELAYSEFDKGNISKAKAIFEAMRKNGDVYGYFGLGMIYQHVNKDYKKAFELYEIASERNVPEAMHNIGFLYQHGLVGEKNISKAIGYYQKAAELGFERSQHDLAYLYHMGLGIEKDIAKALYWYQKAADQGAGDSLFNMGAIYFHEKLNYLVAYKYFFASNLVSGDVDSKLLSGLRMRLSNEEVKSVENEARILVYRSQKK